MDVRILSVLLTPECLSKTPLSFQSSWLCCSQVGTSLPLEQLWCFHSGEKQEVVFALLVRQWQVQGSEQ